MSRLPRTTQSPGTDLESAPTLKRKAEDDENIRFNSKVPALGAGARPVKLLPSAITNGPATRSRPPLVNTTTINSGIAPPSSKFKRSTSAPPKSTKPLGGQTSNITMRNRNPSGGKSNAPQRVPILEEDRLKKLQNQMATMEAARLADSARLAADMEAERLKVSELQHNHQQLSTQLSQARTMEIETRRNAVQLSDEIDTLRQKHRREVMELELDKSRQEREIRSLKDEIATNEGDLRRERETISKLKGALSQQQTENITLSTRINAIQAVSGNIQDHLDKANEEIRRLEGRVEEERARVAHLEGELQQAETLRRKLHNTIQELKGNIRVFCRVRPPLVEEDGEAGRVATIEYPDGKDHREIKLSSMSESATGQERKEQWSFSFDRVFQPVSTQQEVFEEISQLVQSCTDGYNVCIFAYGQTGSGKSFTMEGGPTLETRGMIPRAVQRVFQVTEELKSKGWEYSMEGQFLEIYNETLNDLLGKHEFDQKKHEIKHEKGSTRVTDVVVVPLTSPTQVRTLLQRAQSRRSVASTLMNERSSRSHSVFTLQISGVNSQTGESCEGSLNLVDLAGSERLNSSGAGSDKDRLKETQSINKSLSALADVIGALGEKSDKSDKHIPYRNSKLTYLLQNSLSGNSKTLMVLNVSPLYNHLGETLCSLRFATKVNNTTIGTARKQRKCTNGV